MKTQPPPDSGDPDDHPLETPDFSLSRYFPEGTEYFYGYPAETDSHFFNGVAPEIEELVAARPLVCSGPGVKTICFKASLESFTWEMMVNLGSLNIDKRDVLVLPEEINNTVKGPARNTLLKQALVEISHPGKLVMAQPFLDTRLKGKYEIPSHRIIWLNDKRNMTSYIPWQYIPKSYDEFLDGQCFDDSADQIPLPCVIKVSSSSSGDGVRVCHTETDIANAKNDFSRLEGIILINELIDVVTNFGVQFGIPEDPEKPIEIINWHEQLTDGNGGFVGGIIDAKRHGSLFKPLNKVILEKILPEVRRRGWFGIGGFDILMSKDERFYFVDPNFRMTGMTAYDLLFRSGAIKSSLLSFMGMFNGTQEEFRAAIEPLAKVGSPHQRLHLNTLTEHDGTFRFNAALLFDDRKDIPALAQEVLKKGITSSVLTGFSQ